MKRSFIAVGLIIIVVLQCDQGLEPVWETTGITGTIYFRNWPPPDSLKELRLVAFKKFPPDTILKEILTGQAYAYPSEPEDTVSLPFNVDNLQYLFELPADTYGYLVLAHRYGDNRLMDWQAAGQYDNSASDSLPSPFTVTQGELLKDIDIQVDFQHLPIQPF